MRDLIVTENITLDGVIDAAEGWFAPSGDAGEADESDIEAAVREHFAAADAFLVGRVTFEQMRGYWPEQTDDTTGIGDYLNAVAEYVVSSTIEDPAWERTTVLRGPARDEVAALKGESGIGCSPTPWCSGAASGCSPRGRRSRDCVSWRAARFAPASRSRATGRIERTPDRGLSVLYIHTVYK